MSTFIKTTKHPKTGKWQKAMWVDDYFGHYNYGILFRSDGGDSRITDNFDPDNYDIYDERKVILETRESDLEKLDKKLDDVISNIKIKDISRRIQINNNGVALNADILENGTVTLYNDGRVYGDKPNQFTFVGSKKKLLKQLGEIFIKISEIE